MLKPALALILVFSSAKIFCSAACPLTSSSDIPPTTNIVQMNGTWSEYKKTKDFLTNETCITYDFKCSSDTSCTVNLVQKKTTLKTTTLTKSGENIAWGEKDPFYLHVDPKIGYAILWDCAGEANKTYEIAVLMVNVSNDASKEVDTVLSKITVSHAELNVANYTTCGSDTLMMNLTMFVSSLLIIILTAKF